MPTLPPTPGSYKAHARVLLEVKQFCPHTSLRHVEHTRVTILTGECRLEANRRLEPQQRCPAEVAAEAAALRKLAALRQPQTPQQQQRRRSSKAPAADALPCRVAEGLYVGGAAAARNLKALRKRGITAILNASPSLPCYFKDNPEGCFEYLVVPLFDDPEADLLAHVGAANAFIAAARERGGAVLVHCYAGQSRSAALVIAHLMSSQRLSLMDAWAATRAARPCIQPNPGFLRQLAQYSKSLGVAASKAPHGSASQGAQQAQEPAELALVLLMQ